MSLIQPLEMYQTQLRSTQFTNKVHFDKGFANYISNMTLTKSILIRTLLQNNSLSSCELCPLFHLGFSPFTIMLSSYSHGLSLE